MRRAVGNLMVAALLAGCATGLSVHARARHGAVRALGAGDLTDAQCAALLAERDRAILAGKVLAGIGGVSALGTAPDSVPEAARWAVGATAAASAAVGVVVIGYGEAKAREFERYCELAADEDAPGRGVDATAAELGLGGDAGVPGAVPAELGPNPFRADGGVE